jgi:hypothetical protein
LKNELPKLRESARILNSEFLFVRLEAVPTEAVRFTVRPLNRVLVSPRESVNDLKNEFLLARAVDEPIESAKIFARPLT